MAVLAIQGFDNSDVRTHLVVLHHGGGRNGSIPPAKQTFHPLTNNIPSLLLVSNGSIRSDNRNIPSHMIPPLHDLLDTVQDG